METLENVINALVKTQKGRANDMTLALTIMPDSYGQKLHCTIASTHSKIHAHIEGDKIIMSPCDITEGHFWYALETKKGQRSLVIRCDKNAQFLLHVLGDKIQQNKTMFDAFEQMTCNGLNWINPEDIGALTDAPILSECVGDCGSHTGGKMRFPKHAQFFFYGDYALRSPLEELRDNGTVVFTKA